MRKIFVLFWTVLTAISVQGQSWDIITLDDSGRKLRAMCSFSEDEAFVCGYDSIFFKTLDGGLSWEHQSLKEFYPEGDHGINLYDASSIGNTALIAIGKEGDNSGFLLKTDDKGDSWNYILPSAFDNGFDDPSKNPMFEGSLKHHFYCVELINENTAFSLMQWYVGSDRYNGIFKTSDGGTNWYYCNTPTIEGNSDGDIVFVGNTGYFAGGAKSYIFKTTDGGDTWQDYTDDEKYAYIWSIKLLGEHEVFILGQDNLFYSNTSDLSNQTILPLNESFSTDIYANSSDAFITFKKHDNIYLTKDQGSSWDMIGDGSTTYIRKCDMIYNNKLYGLSDSKLYTIDSSIFNTTDLYTLQQETFKVFIEDANLLIKTDDPKSSMSLYYISGQLVTKKQFSGQVMIPTSNLTPGIYIVECNKQYQKIYIK